MKTLLIVLAFFSFSFLANSLNAQSSSELYEISKKRVELKFTKSYTWDDILKVQAKLHRKNIDLTYELLQFDKFGFLEKISASIEYKDGTKASFTSGLLEPGDGPGFERDLSR